jgi:D-tyrosyl-tRNA(Tyr) deacylase
MKAVIQRVSHAEVEIDGSIASSINRGLLLLLGVEKGDTDDDLALIVQKVSRLRIFEDSSAKMNLSVKDVLGEILVVSQFTLTADCGKGNRPSFMDAEEPDKANEKYLKVVEALQREGIATHTGRFAARMQVSLTNDGPVTILLDSRKLKKKLTRNELGCYAGALHRKPVIV